MAYDDSAKRLVIKVIGTVESGLNYEAINYGDPITVGIAQWYGVRAASILCRMRDENPAAWTGVAASINNGLLLVPADNPQWNQVRLTQTEGESLRPVLNANRHIQDDQCVADMEVYKQVAINSGMDPENNTDAVIFFFTMYHQGPVYAFQVLDAVGAGASLEQIHAGALANPVLGQYSNRYNEAYQLIRDGDVSGTEPPPSTGEPVPAGAELVYISHMSNTIFLHMDNETIPCYPNGSGYWIPSRKLTTGAPVDPTDPTDPEVPPVTPGDGTWTHPLPGGTVSSGYGPRGGMLHAGADISSVGGTGPGAMILASTDMVITVAREVGTGGLADAGTYVKGHSRSGTPYTFNHFHGHPGTLKVRVGDQVNAGAPLMQEGNSGNSFGSHLHLEIWQGHLGPASVSPIGDGPWYYGDGTPGDPLPILRANGVNI